MDMYGFFWEAQAWLFGLEILWLYAIACPEQSWLDAGVEHFDLNETSATLDFRGTAKGPLAFALRTELFSLDRDETPTEMPSEFQRC